MPTATQSRLRTRRTQPPRSSTARPPRAAGEATEPHTGNGGPDPSERRGGWNSGSSSEKRPDGGQEPSKSLVTNASLDGSLIVSVSGELDLVTAPQLEKVLAALSGSEPVIVDLSALDFIDSSGLHLLLKKRPHGRPAAVVVAPDSHVAHVFEIVGAGETLFVCPDVQTAIRNVGQTAA